MFLIVKTSKVHYLDRLEDDIKKTFQLHNERDPPIQRSDVFLESVKGLVTYHKIDLPEITWRKFMYSLTLR